MSKFSRLDYELFAAIRHGDANLVQVKINEGADPNAINRGGETALEYAAGVSNPEVVRVLLENGATDIGKLPLIAAASQNLVDTINLFVMCGADVNESDENGWTSLMEASNWGNEAVMTALIAHGADINARTINGITPLQAALLEGHEGAAKLLRDAGASN